MKKKCLAVMMTLAMVLSLVPMTALAEENVTPAEQMQVEQQNEQPKAAPQMELQEEEQSPVKNGDGGQEAPQNDSEEEEEANPQEENNAPSNNEVKGEEDSDPADPVPTNVAKIGDTEYATLDEAIEAAGDVDTIQLLKDFSVETGITVQNKTLTIQGDGQNKQTITLKVLGIHADKSNLTFKDCGLEITANDNPGHGGTANLIANSNLTFDNVKLTISSEPEGQGSGLYLYQESNLYLTNYSVAKVSGYNAKKASGIYADNSEYDGMPNRNIKVSNHAVLTISDCDWHGMTINPIDLTIDGYSKIDISECGNEGYGGGLGCYYGKLTISNYSSLDTSNNNGSKWGTFVKELSLDGTSTLISCRNDGNGIDIGGFGEIMTGATVTIEGNKQSGLVSYTGSNYWFGDVNVAEGANVEIHNNAHGIYVKPDGKLDMQAGNVTLNKGSEYGGGLWNEGGTVTLENKVALYNNHATKAGDDVYNEKNAALTFSSVGSNWTLDDCNDSITGWFDDAEGTRWDAHGTEKHTVEVAPGTLTATAGEEEKETTFQALKAAHAVKKSGGHRPSNPTIDIPDDDVPTGLDLKNHYGYIIGYPVDYYTGEPTTDQTKKPVRPEGKITRAEVATIYFRMLTEENRAANWNQVSGFSDVKRSSWYNNAISTLTKAGILKGYEDGTFQPNGYITRAEFATIAIRFFNGVYEGEDLFPDIKDHWARDYINNAADKGLVKGYEDGTFGPDRYITRAEAVTLVNRTLNRHPHQDGLHEDMLVWPDNMDKTKWYYADMQEATNSHEPDKDKTDAQTEYWSKMLPIRDWEALEKEWSNANSAPGEGEVV